MAQRGGHRRCRCSSLPNWSIIQTHMLNAPRRPGQRQAEGTGSLRGRAHAEESRAQERGGEEPQLRRLTFKQRPGVAHSPGAEHPEGPRAKVTWALATLSLVRLTELPGNQAVLCTLPN